MSITDVIALLAFIVALYSAILSTYTAINEFFRLKLSILDLSQISITLTKNNYYINEYGEHRNTYFKDLYTIIIPIRIVNKSKNSTTINEIILNNKYVLNSSSNFDSCIPTSFKNKGNIIIASSSNNFKYQLIKPLFELKPLASYESYLIFNNVKEVPSKFNIKVNAVQKSKTFHLHFKIANDYRNEIKQE